MTRRRLMLVLLLAAAVIAGGHVWVLRDPPLYRITILPSLRGASTEAHSLNDMGQVAGVTCTGGAVPAGTPAYIGSEERLFLWDRRKGIQDIGPAMGISVTIETHGHISGTMPMDPNSQQAFLWEPDKGRTRIGALSGKESTARAMNNRGQIVGEFRDVNGAPHAFVWDKVTGMRKLNAPDGSPCQAVSINDTGQILIASFPIAPRGVHWFLVDSNETTAIDEIQESLHLRSVNSKSRMGGVDESHPAGERLIVRQRQTTLRWLSSTTVVSMSRLNDRDQIAYTERHYDNWWENLIGRILKCSHATVKPVSYLWDPVRGRVPLDRYLRDMDWFNVRDINNNGVIVGVASKSNTGTFSVLLEPIPERWRK